MKLAAALVTLVIAAPAGADTAQPDGVRLRNVSYAGSGCAAGSVGATLEGSIIKTVLPHFVVEAGPGVPMTQSRKNCQILFDLEVPRGWSHAVSAVTWSSELRLDAGAATTFRAMTYYAGAGFTAAFDATKRGPYTGLHVARIPARQLLCSPCGHSRAMNFNMQVRAESRRPAPPGMIRLPALDHGSKVAFELIWRECGA